MPSKFPTEHAARLAEALGLRGVLVEEEHYDGHKHVDIYIPAGNLYIEVDGVPHYTRPDQLIADFHRDYFSFKEGFFTKHITNESIDTHLDKIADAIAQIVKEGPLMMEGNLKNKGK
jgi:very-short-patch-repair endonuclease